MPKKPKTVWRKLPKHLIQTVPMGTVLDPIAYLESYGALDINAYSYYYAKR